MFESSALLRNLRSLMTQSRPLRASDVLRANDATQQDDSTVFVDQVRITTPLASSPRSPATSTISSTQRSRRCCADTTANRDSDHRQGRHIPRPGGGLARARRPPGPAVVRLGLHLLRGCIQAFVDLLAQIGRLVTRWTQKLSDFNNALNAYDALPASTQRRRSLRRAAGR